MTAVVPADGLILKRVLDLLHRLRWTHGLNRDTYGRLEVAQTKTAWGSRRRQRVALLKGDADVLAAQRDTTLPASWINVRSVCARWAR